MFFAAVLALVKRVQGEKRVEAQEWEIFAYEERVGGGLGGVASRDACQPSAHCATGPVLTPDAPPADAIVPTSVAESARSQILTSSMQPTKRRA